jgi:pSer/pThr/pTyr-binding forkhead associated (FHA) protein
VRVRLAADPAVRRSFVRSEARFETPAGSAPAANLEDTRRLEMVSPPASAILLAGEDGQELRVGIGSVRIGRGLDNDFIVRDVRVSRHHASMDHDGQHWLIRDLESTNGTYVAGERVRQAAIDSATEVSLGGYRLSVRPVETRRAD